MIYQKDYLIENPKATVIITHGIGEHSKRYEYLAFKLNKHGFDVITYDNLGHGRSSGKRGKIKSFKDHVETLRNIVLKERERTSNKIILLGHSMGGGIVNLYEAMYHDSDLIVSVAAATDTPSNMKIFKYTGFYLLRWVRINTKIFKNDLAKNPNIYLATKNDPLQLKYMYLSLLGEMFIKGIKYLKENIGNFKTPILYVHGTSDKIVDYRFSQNMYDSIKTKDKTIKLYEGEYHELLNDYNKDIIINDIINWINDRT